MKLGFDKILLVVGILIGSLFIVLGSVLLFTQLFSYIPNDMKKIVGVILLAYGLIRIISLINKLNTNNHEAE
jgi:cadmium resistance protein CadD (predicted permease)